jgi:hypothetical protein
MEWLVGHATHGPKRQKIQMELAFMSEVRGVAPMTVNKETEVPMVKHESEDPALTVLLMEQICQRENLSKALQRVRQNKGSGGIDGMTVNKLLPEETLAPNPQAVFTARGV